VKAARKAFWNPAGVEPVHCMRKLAHIDPGSRVSSTNREKTLVQSYWNTSNKRRGTGSKPHCQEASYVVTSPESFGQFFLNLTECVNIPWHWFSRITHYILHITYCILHITYYILHITYYILHITFYILLFTYYILHITYYILHIAYYMFHITYYILHIAYYILHIAYYILHIAYYILHIAYYILHITYYILHITYYMLHVTYYILHITYYILHITYYILHITYFTYYILHITYYILHITYFTYSILHITECMNMPWPRFYRIAYHMRVTCPESFWRFLSFFFFGSHTIVARFTRTHDAASCADFRTRQKSCCVFPHVLWHFDVFFGRLLFASHTIVAIFMRMCDVAPIFESAEGRIVFLHMSCDIVTFFLPFFPPAFLFFLWTAQSGGEIDAYVRRGADFQKRWEFVCRRRAAAPCGVEALCARVCA